MGMVQFLAGQFEAEVGAARARRLGLECPTLQAMIDVTEGWLHEQRDLAQAILATKATQPDLSEPFVEVKARLKAAIEAETADLGRAWAIWASLEGLHFFPGPTASRCFPKTNVRRSSRTCASA
ncbi:hypothetical protein QW131_06335 [Roseibium salinum]|nr:hypothetical protein [Roseibium salinum]